MDMSTATCDRAPKPTRPHRGPTVHMCRYGQSCWRIGGSGHGDLFECAAQSCTQVQDVPFSKGNYFDIAATEGGGLAIAIQSGRPWLCIEECADPTDQLSQPNLHFIEPTD